MSILKVSKIQHINSSGDGFVFDEKGTVGIGTSVMDTNVIGAASSAVGLYIGDGSLLLYPLEPTPPDVIFILPADPALPMPGSLGDEPGLN